MEKYLKEILTALLVSAILGLGTLALQVRELTVEVRILNKTVEKLQDRSDFFHGSDKN